MDECGDFDGIGVGGAISKRHEREERPKKLLHDQFACLQAQAGMPVFFGFRFRFFLPVARFSMAREHLAISTQAAPTLWCSHEICSVIYLIYVKK